MRATAQDSTSILFFFNAPATTKIYTLSLHDALPISNAARSHMAESLRHLPADKRSDPAGGEATRDRKSTRLNSSHVSISYAVFCLKKKNTDNAMQISNVVPNASSVSAYMFHLIY